MTELSEIVNLNVGGTHFTTTLSTLRLHSSSVLAAMFDPDRSRLLPALRDSSGAYFIDRDPKAFAVVLNYLRTGKVYQDRSGISLEQLEDEADFFGLLGMLDLLESLRESSKRQPKLENGAPKDVLIFLDCGPTSDG
jgi:hypothetical protein